jgi:hypothetical protein
MRERGSKKDRAEARHYERKTTNEAREDTFTKHRYEGPASCKRAACRVHGKKSWMSHNALLTSQEVYRVVDQDRAEDAFSFA